MQGSREPSEDGIISDINVTPLVDIILVLLIIFMMTANIILNPTKSLEINLPKASTSQADRTADELSVAIARDNEIYVDNKKTTKRELRELMTQAYRKNKNTFIIFSADAEANWRTIIEMIDMAKEIGLNRIGFATEPNDKEKKKE